MELPFLPVVLAVGGFVSWAVASFCVHALISKVNARLPPDQQVSHFVASRNHSLIRQKYREAYPKGHLPLVITILTIDGAALLAAAAVLLVMEFR